VKRNRDRKELIIHRIIADTARARMGPDVQQSTFETAAMLLHVSWPFSHFDFLTERWVECEPLVPHVGNIARYYEENAMTKTSKSVHTRLAALIMEYGWYVSALSNYMTAGLILQLGITLREETSRTVSHTLTWL
jgi:hypothetical protein